jgi:hypothetical protein
LESQDVGTAATPIPLGLHREDGGAVADMTVDHLALDRHRLAALCCRSSRHYGRKGQRHSPIWLPG